MSLIDAALFAQKPAAMKAAHDLLRMVTSNPMFAAARDDHDTLTEIMEDMGFEGLWRFNAFSKSRDFDKQVIGLTEKLIEVSLYGPLPHKRCGALHVRESQLTLLRSSLSCETPKRRDILGSREESCWISRTCISHSNQALNSLQSDGGCMNIYKVYQGTGG